MSTRMVAATGWRYAKTGSVTKVLQYEKYRVPFKRDSSDLVIKMLAAPVHKLDKNLIEGNYGDIKQTKFPAVGGIEGVGVVEDVGTAVKLGVKQGDTVWINNQTVGTWSTHVVTNAENVDVVPNRVDVDVEFLSCMTIFHTAWHLIHHFQTLQPGDVVLQAGASSSVTQLCMAYARSRGAKLFSTMQGGRTEHTQLCLRAKFIGGFCVVPYSYARSNYMRRLLSDVPPPKLLLNHVCGPLGSQMVKLLGDNGTCVTYGSASGKPMQVANSDLFSRGLTFTGFNLHKFNQKRTREARMRTHQNVIENLMLSQGQATFKCQRYQMDADSIFAFSNAWDAPLSSRKSILRMVGEYGEWRRPNPIVHHYQVGRAIWEDLLQQLYECTGASDTPQSMKYYTPFGDFYSDFNDAKQSKQMGHREVFFKRPNAPKHNTAEDIANENKMW
jgi:NADPH:quinone reductase-like Zn-dependent oxidoreductase